MGTLLNNIRITRTDSSGNTTALLKVPITYGPKDKMLARVFQDALIDRETAIVPTPVISFEMGQDRKSTRLNSSHTDISRMPSSA